MGVTCVFLATKVEETPKKLDHVLQMTHKLSRRKSDDSSLDRQALEEMRERILVMERVVLYTCSFDLVIEHPYIHILGIVKTFK